MIPCQFPGTVKLVPETVHSAYLPCPSVGAGVPPSSIITKSEVPPVTLDSQLTLLNVVKLVAAS